MGRKLFVVVHIILILLVAGATDAVSHDWNVLESWKETLNNFTDNSNENQGEEAINKDSSKDPRADQKDNSNDTSGDEEKNSDETETSAEAKYDPSSFSLDVPSDIIPLFGAEVDKILYKGYFSNYAIEGLKEVTHIDSNTSSYILSYIAPKTEYSQIVEKYIDFAISEDPSAEPNEIGEYRFICSGIGETVGDFVIYISPTENHFENNNNIRTPIFDYIYSKDNFDDEMMNSINVLLVFKDKSKSVDLTNKFINLENPMFIDNDKVFRVGVTITSNDHYLEYDTSFYTDKDPDEIFNYYEELVDDLQLVNMNDRIIRFGGTVYDNQQIFIDVWRDNNPQAGYRVDLRYVTSASTD